MSNNDGKVILGPEQPDDVAISLDGVSCNWNEVERVDRSQRDKEIGDTCDIPALTDISLDFRKGQLTCLVGPVGSGKSEMLTAYGCGPVRLTRGSNATREKRPWPLPINFDAWKKKI